MCISINGFDIMVALLVYNLSILSFYVKYLPNILCPYYKFIQTILFYLRYYKLNLLILILILNYVFILITSNKKFYFKIILDYNLIIIIISYRMIIMKMILEW